MNGLQKNKSIESNDLYNRKELLKRSLKRLEEELNTEDREDILTLVQFQKDKQNELLWINRCITALIVSRQKLNKSFRFATKDDIRELFECVDKDGYTTPKGERRQYKGTTDEKFRKIKLFYKVVYTQNKFYPEAVGWLSTKLRKGKYGNKIDTNMFLDEEEVLKGIGVASSFQKRVMFACWYECGGRPEHFMLLIGICTLEIVK